MQQIKINETTAAFRRVPVALVDSTDGFTPKTGISLIAGDMKISKMNGATETNHGGSLIEQAGGDYYYEFAASEVDTLGALKARIVKTGVRTFRIAVQVVAYDPYATPPQNGALLLDPIYDPAKAAATATSVANVQTTVNTINTNKSSQASVDAVQTTANAIQTTVNTINSAKASQTSVDAVQTTVNTINSNKASQSSVDAVQTSITGVSSALGTKSSQASVDAVQASVNVVPDAFPLKRNVAGQFVPFYMRDASDTKLGKSGTPTIQKKLDGATSWSSTTGTVAVDASGDGTVSFSPSAADCNASLCRYKATLAGAVTEIVSAYTHA